MCRLILVRLLQLILKSLWARKLYGASGLAKEGLSMG